MAAGRRVISPEALADLKLLEDYIAVHDGEARADKAVERINKAIDLLALMPGIGNTRYSFRSGRRSFSVRPWLIVYGPVNGGVLVLRVLDGRRDLPSLLDIP